MEWFSWSSVGQALFKFFYKQKKRISINNKVGVVYYAYKAIAMPMIVEIEINVLILNKSNRLITLTDFTASFYDGNDWHDLYFDPTKVPPFETIDPERPKNVIFKFEISDEIPLPMFFDIPISHLMIRYNMGKRKEAVFMDEIRIFEKQSPYSWVAM
jgi:hypothetical protein